MRILVRADNGDEITINADDLAVEQQIVWLEVANLSFEEQEIESVALTTAHARELASALLTIAEAVDGYELHEKKVYARSRSAAQLHLV